MAMGRTGGILAQEGSLVARASSLSSSRWHDPLPSSVSWRPGLKFGSVTRASSPSSWECHAPPHATVLRRWVSEELFLTWALLGLAPAASCPGVNSSFTEEWIHPYGWIYDVKNSHWKWPHATLSRVVLDCIFTFIYILGCFEKHVRNLRGREWKKCSMI